MKNIITALLFLITFTTLGQTKIPSFYHLNIKQNAQVCSEISLKQIKKEIKFINDSTRQTQKIVKIIPREIDGVPIFVIMEAKFTDQGINKLSIVYSGFHVSVLEEYYFKNNLLIGYKIYEYHQGNLAHSEIGYLKDYNVLTAFINSKKCKLSDKDSDLLLDETMKNLLFFMELYSNN